MPNENTEVIDRGDSLTPPVAAAPAEEVPSAEALAAEALAAAATAKAAETPAATTTDDAPARDAGGKFAKKEGHEEDRIPKERFNEAVGKERAAREAAEARAAAAEALVKKEDQNEELAKFETYMTDLEQKHAKHMLDGENVKAAEVMRQIRHAERQFASMQSDSKVAMATSAAVEQVRMDTAISSLESTYPALNPKDETTFDQDLVDIVLAEQDRLIRVMNYAPSRALTAAADKIMSKFAKPAEKEGTKEAEKEKEKEKAAGLGAAKGAESAESRKAAQVAKNLETAAKQPANTKESGKDSDKGGTEIASIAGMTKAEINALPESTRAKLRGDFV